MSMIFVYLKHVFILNDLYESFLSNFFNHE